MSWVSLGFFSCVNQHAEFCRLVVRVEKNKQFDSVVVFTKTEKVAALKTSKQMKLGIYKLLLPVKELQHSRVCLIGQSDTLCSDSYLFKKGEYYEFEAYTDSIFLSIKE